MKSIMSHSFSQVPQAEIQRSSFDRSHGYKTTFDAGFLVPIFVDEALPGDTFNLSLNAFARLATPIKAPMDNMFFDTFFFAVPIRLIWDNWKKMNGEQDNPGDTVAYTVPQSSSAVGASYPAGYPIGSLQDYLGLPTLIASPYSHSALFTRAYNLIWNNWFRDQNLQNSVTVDKGAGPDTPSNYVLLRRGKRHDYFTSCLPLPQRGPSVTLPLGTSAAVSSNNLSTADIALHTASGNITGFSTGAIAPGDVGQSTYYGELGVFNVLPGKLVADLSTAAAATINAIRSAFQIQRLYERDARGGTRYIEILKAHFGVTSPDARLQRPEYLGGGETPVNISPVIQTGEKVTTTPQGNVAGYGTVSVSGHGFSKSFTEHCIILGLASVRADLTYQQGLNRMWSRTSRFDFYWPALANLGEQAVLRKEIYCQGISADDTVFGYQERYAEYRYKPSQITGQFRSYAPTPLDIWHLSEKFTSAPTLSAAFIEDNPPVDRIIAVPSEPHFLYDSYIRLVCARPMPVYSVPGLIDHF